MKPLRIGLGIDHRFFLNMKSRKEGAYLLRQFWTVLLALGLNLYSLASSPTPRDPLVEELRLLDAGRPWRQICPFDKSLLGPKKDISRPFGGRRNARGT